MIEMVLIGDSGISSTLRSTFSHPYWVHGKGWMQAGEIQVGAELSGGDQLFRVSALRAEVRPETVYNLEVEADRTYFVGIKIGQEKMGSVWVHNGCAMREIIENSIRKLSAEFEQLPTDVEMLMGVKQYTEVIARAGGRLLFADRVFPFGFQSFADFKSFSVKLREGLVKAGYKNAEPVFQGSSVSGFSFRRMVPFDAVSDFDIAIVAPDLLAKAKKLGVEMRNGGIRSAPLKLAVHPRVLEQLGLKQLLTDLSALAGRKVEVMIYADGKSAILRGPSMIAPR
jgi:hypothetical protein